MNLTAICITALCLSAALVAVTLVVAALLRKSRSAKTQGTLKGAKYALSPFHITLIGFFVAATVILYPIYYVDFLAGESGFLKILKAILLAVHNALRLFTLNGEFDLIRDFFADPQRVTNIVATLYSIYVAAIFVIAPAMTAGFILSFFKEASALLRYTFARKSDVYIISELNERSLALAEDIFSGGGRRLVVFTDVFEVNEEKNFELVEKAKRLGAICMRKDVTEIGLKYTKKDIYRKIYLMGDDEDENIQQAISVIGRCQSTPRYNTEKTQVYVFSNTAESEALLNTVKFGNVKVRRVNWSRSLAVDTIRTHSIFENAVEKNGEKEINIVIAGLGLYGTELLKTVLWCGQMPGYRICVHVFDREDGCEKKVRSFAPELIKYNNKQIEGEAFYNIIFHDNTDVKSGSFQDELAKLKNVTTAFVTLGDDELNIEAAIKMRMQFGRNQMQGGGEVPPILTVVNSIFKTRAAEGGLENFRGVGYGITFIGDTSSRYSLKTIEQNELEISAREFHTGWVEKENVDAQKKEQLFNGEVSKYNKYEYYRRSSMAQAIYADYRTALGFEERDDDSEESKIYNDMLQEYEHRRWNVYMRCEGYVYNEKRDDTAKTHPDLKPYQGLTDDKKRKDSLKKRKSR